MRHLDHVEITTLAARMLGDYDRHEPGTPFADGLRLSIDDAYRLQGRVAQLREDRGERLVGYKIGCVSAVNQQRNGLSHPVYGRLWSTEQYATDVTLSANDFANVAVEGECAVTLGAPVDPADSSLDTIVSSVEQAFSVIELHNLVFRGVERGPELIANNAIHAGVVRPTGVEPPAAGATVDLSVDCDGHRVGHWTDYRWPHDVLQALPWLVRELDEVGVQLQAGQMILVGAWGPPIPLAPSGLAEDAALGTVGRVEVVSSVLGSVAASFAPVTGT